MKNFMYSIILVCFFTSSSNKSFASHFTGGEISYTCSSTSGVWLITLTLYNDCSSGVGFCSGVCDSSCFATVSISNYSGPTYNSSANLNLISVSDIDPNPLCPSSKSICTNNGCVTAGTFTPGLQKFIFQGTVNLGSSSGISTSICNIRISYSTCCRSGAISTGSAGQNFYIEAIIN